ncbi:DUF1064 domain-containing protein [Sesbania bispinosa]|nr:DUF1064 domain-containing protein [Sesbania bispinosa]
MGGKKRTFAGWDEGGTSDILEAFGIATNTTATSITAHQQRHDDAKTRSQMKAPQ